MGKVKIEYDKMVNALIALANRTSTISNQGALIGSDGKDFQNTSRSFIQVWQPLQPDERNFAEGSAIHPYGKTRTIKQRYLENSDHWQIGGKSWHWTPVTADVNYERNGE